MYKKLSAVILCGIVSIVSVFGQTNDQFKNADPKQLVNRKDLTEAQLEEIQRYYKFELKDSSRARQLEELLIKKNPKGDLARLHAFQNFLMSGSNEKIIRNAYAFLEAFPYPEWKKQKNKQAFIYYTTHRMLGTALFESRRYKELLQLTPGLDFRTENEIYRWNIGRAYAFKLVGFDTVYKVSTPLINDLIKKVNDGSYTEEGVFNKEQGLKNASDQLNEQLSTYISLLRAMQRYSEAKEYFKYLSAEERYASADLNAIYLEILGKLGDTAAIQPFIEKCVASNAVTPGMFDKLKSIYLSKHKDLKGYDEYLESLYSSEKRKAMKKYVEAHMVNIDFVPFALEDTSGKMVRSSDWEGKIVVMDFWATWCKPCISAFPGMQMLIDKYAADDKVIVYMVGTMQSGDYKEKSVGFIKREGYRFNLLHDLINKETGEQNAVFGQFAKIFQSSAIPRKIIVKDGVMRYTSEGYSGSPSKLADELSYAIEILKSEK